MTAQPATAVVIAAGGLGTRVAGWSPFLPKEFRPVGGRPGLLHVLESAASGAPRAVVVHHPYYAPLIDWTSQVVAPGALARYQELAQQPVGRRPSTEALRVDFIAQHGPYADVTSAFNGAEHLRTGDICLAFADNVDPSHTALSQLVAAASPGTAAVLAGPFDLDAAVSHGVIICAGAGPLRTMASLVEKPSRAHAAQLAADHGPDNLRLLQGRVRLTPRLLRHLSQAARRTAAEPKLSLALAAYARHHPVEVVTNTRPVIDLGTPDSAEAEAVLARTPDPCEHALQTQERRIREEHSP
ncbi:sugar phosphate nucleotidyltransferase [Streptomyces sp. XY413]|uniref:sugar phosphate nucleotidyltransferase n=1 Tax=Streptomyces sp. XY413 TaxID=1519479 RepID=UPI00131E7680|nr:sugar phosphate nucleotidyltransferase [Streptomyces sp. XY413]